MKKEVIDIDSYILKKLSQNARIPTTEIAKECGISRAAMHQHIKRLRDTGILKNPQYNIDPFDVGYTSCAYIGVRIESGALFNNISEELKKFPEIVECNYATGPYSIVLKVYTRTRHRLMVIINEVVNNIDGVVGTDTMIVLDQSINRSVEL
ncbi:MAG: Lrp/AsnC ligand binding domain-containing protein [Muribaculaceae bacterium]|nr:Lrp/AsnC ligand binding domain-containing protein [Muribaculaceae bacterium]